MLEVYVVFPFFLYFSININKIIIYYILCGLSSLLFSLSYIYLMIYTIHYVRIETNCASAGNLRKEGNVLFNDALNTFYLRLYGVRHMVKDHSDSEKGNPLPPHRLLFPSNSKGSFICIFPQTG